jgi:hypothetical protein
MMVDTCNKSYQNKGKGGPPKIVFSLIKLILVSRGVLKFQRFQPHLIHISITY